MILYENISIDLCKLYILFATGFGGKKLRLFQAKNKILNCIQQC